MVEENERKNSQESNEEGLDISLKLELKSLLAPEY